MKHFLFGFLAALFSLLSGNAEAQVQGPIYCNAQATSAAIGTATTTAVISQPASGDAHTYICGYTISVGAITTGMMDIQFEYGTTVSTACDTGAHVIGPVIIPTTNTLIGDAADIFRGFEIPAGNGLCVVTTGSTVVAQVQVFYAQQ